MVVESLLGIERGSYFWVPMPIKSHLKNGNCFQTKTKTKQKKKKTKQENNNNNNKNVKFDKGDPIMNTIKRRKKVIVFG